MIKKYSNSGAQKHLSCKIESLLDIWKYLGFYLESKNGELLTIKLWHDLHANANVKS